MAQDLFSRLTELDAEPDTGLSTAQIERRERLLRAVLSDTGTPGHSAVPTFRRPLVRRTAFTMAGALASGAIVLVMTADPPKTGGSGPLSATEVATWTSTADDFNGAAGTNSSPLTWCLKETKKVSGEGGGGELSNTDIRGTVTSVIVTRHGRAAYCLAGSDGSGTAVPLDPPVKTPAEGITLDAHGARGSGPARFRYLVGSMGSEVKTITVRDHGQTVHATVRHIRTLSYGRWTAWWPDSGSRDRFTGTITLTLTDGTTETIDGGSLSAS